MIDVDKIKSEAKSIHFFGLGFIQVKISESKRYHFYDLTLPNTISEEEIHNHRYHFTSLILKGKLKNDIYVLDFSGRGFELSEVDCKPVDGRVLDLSNKKECSVKLIMSNIHKENEFYFMNHKEFHTVSAEHGTVTLLDRGPYKKELAEVVIPKGQGQVCPFTHVYQEEFLWERVKDLVNV